ncbi:MAG: peptidoglycan DD-metalloendopeptidase family protein [Phycisphaera sp. RhM]|nr:peptidoglycan DD-metalloendopeptidase family protein [Phycisphaera sp. RhM]
MLNQIFRIVVVTAAIIPLSWLQSAVPLLASPPISFIGAEPTESGKLIVFPTASSYAGGPKGWELCFNLNVKNTSANPISLKNAQVVVYSQSGTVLKNVNLFEKLKKKDGDGTSLLVDDAGLGPNEVVRLMMLPDLSFPMIVGQTPAVVKVFLYCDDFSGAATYTNDVLVYHNSVCSFRYPAKLDSLGANQYWNGSSNGGGGHHRESKSSMFALDVGIVRWDNAIENWVELCPNADGSANEDYLVWNKKIYSMADGVVLDFEDGKDDHLPNAEGNGANFIKIRHGNEIARYVHFRKNTLNSELMEVGAAVSAGQFLGRIGNSGNSSHPHLHVEIQKSGIGRPIGFRDIYVISDVAAAQAFAKGQAGAPFTLMDGEALPWCENGERNLVYPAPNDLACGSINPSLGGVVNDELAISKFGEAPIVDPQRDWTDALSVPRVIVPQPPRSRYPMLTLIPPARTGPPVIRQPVNRRSILNPAAGRVLEEGRSRRPSGTTRDVPRRPSRARRIDETSGLPGRHPTIGRPQVQVAPLRQFDRRGRDADRKPTRPSRAVTDGARRSNGMNLIQRPARNVR